MTKPVVHRARTVPEPQKQIPFPPPLPTSSPPTIHPPPCLHTTSLAHHRPRIVQYQQSYHHNDTYISLLPLLTHHTATTHVILSAIHLNAGGNLTLNDSPFDAPLYDSLWSEVSTLRRAGIRVLGMLGGAAPGTFLNLSADFPTHYAPLRDMLRATGLDGLDIDVEEETELAVVLRLIDALKADLGEGFLITLAPVATAMLGKKQLSGFDYGLLEAVYGERIAWYNVQMYCGWGSVEDGKCYAEVIKAGWEPERVVLGTITNPEVCKGWVPDEVLEATLKEVVGKYKGFGGVAGWEYAVSITAREPFGWPWSWAGLVTDVLVPGFGESEEARRRERVGREHGGDEG